MARRALRRGSGWAWAAMAIALAAAAAGGMAGIGAQQGRWTSEAAVAALPWIAGAGGLAVLVGLFARFGRRDGQIVAVAAILLGLAVAGGIGQYLWRIAAAPQLIDISTDLEDPPAFTRLAPRADRIAHVPLLDRPGYESLSPEDRWRSVHADAYADLKSIAVALPPAEVIRRATELARDRGWEVALADPPAGRLEITVPSRFFGFRDDLVVRARLVEGRTRVDLRGMARSGTGDNGRIARLIRQIQAELTRTA